MRILLDECLPRPLRNEFPGHEVKTARQMNWAGVENGDLLKLAEKIFDVFITVDRNLEYQQNLGGYQLAVIVLVAKSNKLEALQPLIPSILDVLATIQVGDTIRVAGSKE